MEENELDSYINEYVPFPKRGEAKALHKNKLVMAKRIITDSIKDHLIPQVSSLNTPKEMFDDSEKPIEECKDLERRDHPVLLYKGLSYQRTT